MTSAPPPPKIRSDYTMPPSRTTSGSVLTVMPRGRLFVKVFVDRPTEYDEEARVVLMPLGEDLSNLYLWRSSAGVAWVPQFHDLGYLYMPKAVASVGVEVLWGAEHDDLAKAREIAPLVRAAVSPLEDPSVSSKRAKREQAKICYVDVVGTLKRWW